MIQTMAAHGVDFAAVHPETQELHGITVFGSFVFGVFFQRHFCKDYRLG